MGDSPSKTSGYPGENFGKLSNIAHFGQTQLALKSLIAESDC